MAPVQPAAARTLVAAFNGRFQFPSTDGGYYSEGKLVFSCAEAPHRWSSTKMARPPRGPRFALTILSICLLPDLMFSPTRPVQGHFDGTGHCKISPNLRPSDGANGHSRHIED